MKTVLLTASGVCLVKCTVTATDGIDPASASATINFVWKVRLQHTSEGVADAETADVVMVMPRRRSVMVRYDGDCGRWAILRCRGL